MNLGKELWDGGWQGWEKVIRILYTLINLSKYKLKFFKSTKLKMGF